jgi:hypothetical protein
LPAYGADKRPVLRLLRRPATWLLLLHTRPTHRRLASRLARDIADYHRCGYAVQAVVGVGGSPSCGVRTTLDLPAAVRAIAACRPARLNRHDFNKSVIAAHAVAGQRLFIAELRHNLRRRRLDIAFDEYDLIAEINAAEIHAAGHRPRASGCRENRPLPPGPGPGRAGP